MRQRLGEPGVDWLLVAAVTPDGTFRLYSSEQPFTAEPGWKVLYFAADNKREPRELVKEAARDEANKVGSADDV